MPAAILYALFAQAAVLALPQSPADTRMADCLAQTKADSGTAIETAAQWLKDVKGAQRALPQQCLGVAYSRLGEWDMAEQAFLAARDAVPAEDAARRGRLAAMAGNAALVEGRNADALSALDLARADATQAGEIRLRGEVDIDRARALVPLGRMKEAAEALAGAREDAAQSSDAWLLSATLARRDRDLVSAQRFIETAATLRPVDPAIGLEAGLIAALAGHDDAARKSWQSVVDADPSSDSANAARRYLAQLEQP